MKKKLMSNKTEIKYAKIRDADNEKKLFWHSVLACYPGVFIESVKR